MKGHSWSNPDDQKMLQALQNKPDKAYTFLITVFNSGNQLKKTPTIFCCHALYCTIIQTIVTQSTTLYICLTFYSQTEYHLSFLYGFSFSSLYQYPSNQKSSFLIFAKK